MSKREIEEQAFQDEIKALKERHRKERQRVVLFRSPFKTLRVFGSVVLNWLRTVVTFLSSHVILLALLLFFVCAVIIIATMPGTHQTFVSQVKDAVYVGIVWIFLGLLSSIGLGTGLHTFVLYLGPYIARITLAATECNSIDLVFGPDGTITCPDGDFSLSPKISFFQILRKVQFEAFLWGLGTALGELPPYFVARAARLSGDKLEELDKLGDKKKKPQSIMDRLKVRALEYVEYFGFFGILVFASVPNPLFDLAGLTCGHFLVPFWKFFGATFIGKSIVKSHLQSIAVITVFSEQHLTNFANAVEYVLPFLRGVFTDWLNNEKQKLHKTYQGDAPIKGKGFVGRIWDFVIIAFVLYFLVSIINSAVQHHLARIDEGDVIRLQKRRQLQNGTVAPSTSTGGKPMGADSDRTD